MKFTDIARLRLINQNITRSLFTSPAELVHYMGAIQAQDYTMAKWAMGIRLPGSTLETIETAIAQDDIIRTHLLRPTWHFVAAKDLRWMLKLTAPRVKIAMRSRHKQLGLTENKVAESNRVIVRALSGNKHLTRKQLVSELERAGFENKNNLASHLLLRAELDKIICSGATKGKNYTYTLLDERVPASPELTKEEALSRLARTYFRSHGPATLEDFTWWSGLTKTSARKALEMIKPEFMSEEITSHTYWFDNLLPAFGSANQAWLLPAYDEFIISYKDRRAVIMDINHAKTISNNGIFRPVILVDGQVIGTWKRSVKKEHILVENRFFSKPAKETKNRVKQAAKRVAAFQSKELELRHTYK